LDKEKHILSKSTFIRGIQCLKSLYLHKNRPFLRDKLAPEQLAKFRRGHEVGKLAWALFPGGIDCAPAHPTQFKKSLELTRSLIADGTPVIYEAAFQYNGVLIFLDILVKTSVGYHAYEVKSSLEISETYLTDAALQYNVLVGTGINPLQFSIVHLNEHYCMGKIPDVHKLFSIKNVTDLIIEKQEGINLQIEQAKEAISLKKSPPIDVGKHCYSPYPCDFIGHCWKNVPATSVFHLKGIPAERRFSWMQAGIQSPLEIPSENLTFEEKQIIDIHLSGKTFRNTAYFRQIASIQAPLLITFLTIRPAVPLFEDCKPFQNIIVGFAIKNQGEMNVVIAEPGPNPIQGIEKKLAAIFETHQHIIYAEPESGMDLKGILNSFSDGKEFMDLSEIFQPINYYQAGIDSAASFAGNLSILLPEVKQQPIVSHTMAGVKYLETLKKDKDSTVEALTGYLSENLHRLQRLYDFLVKTNDEENDRN
jgi:hypothetical protein